MSHDSPTPPFTFFLDPNAQQEARSKALADPAVREFLAHLSYPQAAEVLPGMLMAEGKYATTLEDMQQIWPGLEKGYAHMFGPTPEMKKRKVSPQWQQQKDMWSQQRAEREAEKVARQQERDAAKARRAVAEAELEAARQAWKDAVMRKKYVVDELDKEIRSLHEDFTEKRRALERL